MKNFIWFTTHSWGYMRGQRRAFIVGFIPAWRKFHKLVKAEGKIYE
jgi:mannose/fructose/N-acetylgalactosamine-specific phosphotransferase system component IID